jgi:hypothetical protein
MRKSTRGFLRWGALVLEVYSLFVLYSGAFMVPFPYNERLGLIGGAAAVSLSFGVLSSFLWEGSHKSPRPAFRQIALEPPLVLWAIAVIPPTIAAGSEIFRYAETGKWVS